MHRNRLGVGSRSTRTRAALGLAGLTAMVVLGGACNSGVAAIGLVMRAPQGLLDQATAVSLQVADGSEVHCTSDGNMLGTPSADTLQNFSLDHGGCSSGASWCKTITLDQDGSVKAFAVTVTGAGGVIGVGCTKAAVDQDPLEVRVTVHRYNAPLCCGDGVIQAGEQCDTGPGPADNCAGMPADDVCSADCRGLEILMSIDDVGAPNLTNGPARSKAELALAFAGASGAQANGLRAVFTDSDPAHASSPDINERLLDAGLHAYSTPASLAQQLRLLLDCGNITAASGPAHSQHTPAIAMVRSDVTAVAYASDQLQVTKFDVFLSAQLQDGCADNPPVRVNFDQSQSCESPDVARGPDGSALVVWTASGNVRGRIWTFDGSPTGVLTPAATDLVLGQATAGTARVAGSASGWVVVYEANGNVWLETVSPSGTVGAPQQVNAVNEGAQPDVAALSDGRLAVVWRSSGAIYFQRFDAALQRVAGDQNAALGVSSPPGWDPTVAGTDNAGGAFAVAWAGEDGTVWSRYLGGSTGFAYNGVSGQNDDFLASHPDIPGVRKKPAIAIGGNGWVAIGWQDDSDSHPGVFVRRFPLPQ